MQRKSKKKIVRVKPDTAWGLLRVYINEYVDAAIAESWKGGGDPEEIPVVDAYLKLAKTKLFTHLEKMQRDLG